MRSEIKPARIPFSGKNVPHAIIEVNQKCNISCKACYKDKFNYTKPLDQIKSEVDFALSQRNVSTFTLAGGEPTLHPQVTKIIEYIRSKNAEVQILSNGMALSEELLTKLSQAGLKEIYLHIDTEQRRADLKSNPSEDDVEALRSKIGARINKHGMISSLVVTLYKHHLEELPRLVDFAYQSPHITRVLVTCYRDFGKLEEQYLRHSKPSNPLEPRLKKSETPQAEVGLKEVAQVLQESYGMKPLAYIGSNLDPEDERWHIYHSFVYLTKSGRPQYLQVDPAFGPFIKKHYDDLIKKGQRITFGKIMNTRRCLQYLATYALLSLSPKIFFKTAFFLSRWIFSGSDIYYKDFTFQEGPQVESSGELSYCADCPDATVREGQLVPVCMADFMVPLDSKLLSNQQPAPLGT